MFRGSFVWPALLSTVVVGASSDPPQNPASPARPSASEMPRSNPVPSAGVGRKSYGKLFSTTMPAVANIQTTPRTAPSAGTRDQPRVVCGTTLVEVDPALDANIRIERPADHTHYAIKTIEPAVCRR